MVCNLGAADDQLNEGRLFTIAERTYPFGNHGVQLPGNRDSVRERALPPFRRNATALGLCSPQQSLGASEEFE
ncbi:hypothetical protein MPLA_2130091 [Mesorhizobium sp. ORS 3359]|nr:hypothetical protein MPLA_2130091 [Mesorhizobium sp. ORS 3359]